MRPVSRRTSSSASPSRSRATSKCVIASRGSSVSSERRVGSRRSRPIGASIRPRARARPAADERHVAPLERARSRTSSDSRSHASSERATTSSPEVSRSSRCTIPGRVGVAARDAAVEQRVHERPLLLARRPGGRRGRPACRRRAGARPRTRSAASTGCATSGGARRGRLELDLLPARRAGGSSSRGAPSTSDGARLEQPLGRGARADLAGAQARKRSSRSPAAAVRDASGGASTWRRRGSRSGDDEGQEEDRDADDDEQSARLKAGQ